MFLVSMSHPDSDWCAAKLYTVCGWLVSTVGRTLVFGRRTDPVL